MSQHADGIDDATLFDRFLTGDDPAFLELYRRHNQRLFLYCLKIIGERQGAEDMTQEIWEKVIGLRHSREPVRNPLGFLFRVARNLCIDILRKRGRLVSLSEIDENATPLFTTREPSELEEVALASLERLSFEYREVLVLNLYCGYRFDEIAEMLGKSADAIWARASRARTQLRRMVSTAMNTSGDAAGAPRRTPTRPMQARDEEQ